MPRGLFYRNSQRVFGSCYVQRQIVRLLAHSFVCLSPFAKPYLKLRWYGLVRWRLSAEWTMRLLQSTGHYVGRSASVRVPSSSLPSPVLSKASSPLPNTRPPYAPALCLMKTYITSHGRGHVFTSIPLVLGRLVVAIKTYGNFRLCRRWAINPTGPFEWWVYADRLSSWNKSSFQISSHSTRLLHHGTLPPTIHRVVVTHLSIIQHLTHLVIYQLQILCRTWLRSRERKTYLTKLVSMWIHNHRHLCIHVTVRCNSTIHIE